MKTQLTLITVAVLVSSIAIVTLLPVNSEAKGRWYQDKAITLGNSLFQQHCASCHKANAEGTTEWKKRDANGALPPPPLNGTAHAWHHNLEVLRNTIKQGGAKLGGTMPPFEKILNETEIDAVIAYFQSKWSDELYQQWESKIQQSQATLMAPIKPEASSQAVKENPIIFWLKQRLGNTDFSEPKKSQAEDLYHTEFGAKHAYLTKDGRYIIIGDLIDLKTGLNLTGIEKQKTASEEIARVKQKDKAIFPAIGSQKAVLNIFTDTSCPYCKKLHEEVPQLQQAGITVMYLPYPRGSVRGPGYQTLKQVWCAEDKAKAMDIAKEITTGTLPQDNCESASMVDRGYELGNRVGVTGTPALFKSSGELISGYVPYNRLIPMVIGPN